MSKLQEAPKYQSATDFLFNTPLYTTQKMTRFQLTDLIGNSRSDVDGFCPVCRQSSLFRNGGHAHGDFNDKTDDGMKTYRAEARIELNCRRDTDHTLRFYVVVRGLTIQKIGQLPSFVELTEDHRKLYKHELTAQDATEYRQAIELAAHGYSIGAYVYLRRIFERLVEGQFNALKDAKGWDGDVFKKFRMDEKVKFLDGYLPAFLVRNHRIYSILSVGLHELDEERCAGFFPTLRDSILLILQQDKAVREQRDAEQALEKDISAFNPDTPIG